MSMIVPSLWFPAKAEEATAFYAALLPDSRVRREAVMRTAMQVLVLLVAVALNPACSATPGDTANSKPSSATPRGLPADSTAAAALAQSVNGLGCDLYRHLGKESGNLVFSPLSVSAAMGLAYAGAGGTTRTEMQRVLHLPATDARAFAGYRSLFADLDARARADGARWTLANRMWVHEGVSLLPAFARTTRESFGSDVGTLDFRAAPEAGRSTINAWVEKQTEQRIKDLFPPGSIDADTRLVFANAVYFKGLWETPFDKNLTREAPFHRKAGGAVDVPMMSRSGHLGLKHIAGGRVLELPYRGVRLALLVVLPDDPGGLAALEGRLDADSLRAWTTALDDRYVRVGLPRFTVTKPFVLSATLATLGMPSAFDPTRADFSGMTGKRDLSISLVVHKAFVEVNEEGTEAAAATGGVMRVTSAPMPEDFIADRPFLFLIRDRFSGCILFLGRVEDPTL